MFEQVFEHLGVTGSVSALRRDRADESARAAAIERARASLRPASSSGALIAPALTPDAETGDSAQTLPTVSALADLLPSRGLRRGASYSVEGSTTLALATLVGASEAGSWCGVVGMPALGIEAAAGLGVDLDRLALVPSPGASWLEVVAALVEAVDIVVVRPPARSHDAEARRLAARVRQRGAVLVVAGQWPGCELRFTVTANEWTGLGSGHGHLTARQATVSAVGRGSAARPRSTRLWLPAPDGGIRVVEEAARPTRIHPDLLATRAG